MPKWPLLVVMLLGCSGEGDELEAPMLGDCANCGTAPISGGGISGGADASVFDAGADAGFFDATFDVLVNDVGVSSDVNNTPDRLDIVDTGVPADI